MKDDNQVDCSGEPPLKYRVFVLLVIAACLSFWAVKWALVATRHTMTLGIVSGLGESLQRVRTRPSPPG
jgi:hypothetical protein